MDRKVFESISSFDQMEELETKYQQKYGVEPFNISYWDPSDDFLDKMYPYVKIKYDYNPLKYLYTFQIEDAKARILEKLGFDTTKKDGILTTNGTTSIMMMLHWVKERGYQRIHVVYPSYFSIENNCKKENITIVRHDIDYTNGCIININPRYYHKEVFWITNPAYSMGHNIVAANADIIGVLLQDNIVIVDDCVMQNSQTASRLFGNHHNFLGVYAPQKAVCMNGVKFSILVFNCADEPFFDQSIDFLCGGLDSSVMAAISHYISSEYDRYSQVFQTNIGHTNRWIEETCKQFSKCTYINTNNHYINSVYFPHLRYELGNNREFLWNLIDNTGASIITGTQNEYPRESGFSFRINLARESPIFRATLMRLLYFLQNV